MLSIFMLIIQQISNSTLLVIRTLSRNLYKKLGRERQASNIIIKTERKRQAFL